MLNVSTKTGDQGKSSLADGTRLAKDQPVFEVIGTIDELNSQLGLVVASLKQLNARKLIEQTGFMETIQHELFTLGGQVAGAKIKISAKFLKTLEQSSLNLQKQMEKDWHHQFVLPGGHEIAARLDVARAVCRRLERRIVTLISKQTLPAVVLQTINRLADYLYVLRCFVNQTLGKKEKYFTRLRSVSAESSR
jgi:cob(I)alamin adenosyltransferase